MALFGRGDQSRRPVEADPRPEDLSATDLEGHRDVHELIIAVVSALIRPSDLLAQLFFTPLLAGWSIWVAILISTRSNDIRVAQQFAVLASLPSIAVTTLIALDVITVSLVGGLVAGAALLLLNAIGWRLASAMFDRERLIIGTAR